MIDGVFSLRLVIADFYLEKPAQGLDPCYSEFRGKEIKRVPIIRIFGSNGQGQKTCMHVHGVFPYFYIPYEKKDFESVNKAIYQIAFNVDKAINISLGQGSSAAQHVFKIQLVKGVPFYGYHRVEHQFLKIYMFNPRFVRRAANLLQNGAILGKNFHPHESHVPYILQFMIDYNLYGMSLLHVPVEVVKFRRTTDEDVIPFSDLRSAQILSTDLVKKQSVSTLEVDIGSNFILNRFQLVTKKSNSTHTNPGIESIWHDERLRRQKLAEVEKDKAIPPLEIPATQERPNVQTTESEIFYRTALLSKLFTMEESISMGSGGDESQVDQTINCTTQSNATNTTLNVTNQSTREQKRTFNLKKLLANAVYPEECTQEDLLTNASCIENHLSNNSFFQSGIIMDSMTAKTAVAEEPPDDSAYMDDTLLDEQLVLSLTQSQHVPLNASLREEDMQLLDVLQQLEENTEHEHQIDLDSTLAPLSQQHKNFDRSPELLDKEAAAEATHQQVADNDTDSENEAEGGGNVHDFSIAMDDIDELILKLTQTQPTQPTQPPPSSQISTARSGVPQIDGSDDLLLRTPKKSRQPTNSRQLKTPPRTPQNRVATTTGSPTRSPRTPKSNVAAKYAPLPLIITNRSIKKNQIAVSNDTSPPKSSEADSIFKSSRISLRKTLAITEMRRKSISVANELHESEEAITTIAESSKTLPRRSRRFVDLDKTHITCALTPHRKNERILKVYTPDKNSETVHAHGNTDVEEPFNCNEIEETVPQLEKAVKKQITIPIQRATRARTKATNSAEQPETNETTLSTENVKNHNQIASSKTIVEHTEVCKESDLVKNAMILQKSTTETAKPTIANLQINTEIHEVDEEILASDNECAKRSIRINAEVDETEATSTVAELEKFNKQITIPKQRTTRARTKVTNSAEQPNSIQIASSKTIDEHTEACNENDLVKNAMILEKSTTETETAIPTMANLQINPQNHEVEDEEILASDNECAERLIRKTPNLKRLRRSFQAAKSNKRKRLSKDIHSTEEFVCNSSKFDSNETSTSNVTPTTPTCSVLTEPKYLCTKATHQKLYIADDDTSAVENRYGKSFSLNSPSIFSEVSSPLLLAAGGASVTTISSIPSSSECSSVKSPVLLKSWTFDGAATPSVLPQSMESSSTTSAIDAAVIVTPLDLPPTREEVLAGCKKFEIYEQEFQKPYYSNPDDITKQKEIGYTVLQIPGNKLNDCPDFKSVLGADAKGLIDWRRRKLLDIGGPPMLNRYRNPQRIREYFSSQKRALITPHASAPTRHEAKLWLKARELLKTRDTGEKTETRVVVEDSPIKVRRQKVTMMLNEDASGAAGSDEDLNCSSLSLTPMTPASSSKQSKESEQNKLKDHTFTPLTTIDKDSPTTRESAGKYRRHSRRHRTKTSLNEQLKTVDSEKQLSADAPKIKCIASELLLASGSAASSNDDKLSQVSTQLSSQSSDTSVGSHLVLDALERSSFVRNLDSCTSSGQHEVSFGLSSATLNNTFGFKVNLENLQQAKSDVEYNYLTTVTLEVFVPTRDDLYPNPELDAIRCIFYAIENSIPTDCSSIPESTELSPKACGYIMVNDISDILSTEGKIHGIDADINVKVVRTESEALQSLLDLCALWDPDIYAGYEIEMSSWGYIMERAKYLCINIGPLLSRVPTQKMRDFVDEDREQFTDLDVEMKLCGRILLDVWRLMRSEIALTSYTFENLMYHILHKRCPWHSYRELTSWFSSPCSRWIVIEYYLERVRGTLSLLDQLDLIGRTSEMAKLIGIQFYEVLSRGSQFRVESMMLRIAKPKNLVPFSPSVQQRAHMRAPEYLALIMEPQSRFYADPLIVLDFQSLYPSMIIAYNYCFSTCLGRVEHLGQSSPFEFAASQLRVSPTMLRKLLDRDLVTISPCGVVFVKASVREGILPRMLTEILDTRQMVKQSMKLHKSNSALQRILHSRQLGLKLMANVTYGYTAANFSGRMPAVEVGDTVVSKGRETLERAIKMVQSNAKWNVQVVYGDTDSMFVLVPGRTREQAFKIGEEIAEAVTQANPQPVKLKLEKVYQPCILQTKKRYVGYMYETADQSEPVYEAKGIETVRRDGCPAVAKMLEKVLRILFETADVSQVKQYVCRQFTKLLSGRANLQDLIFAKEFRGLSGYKPTACVPALELTRKWQQTDPRRIPRRGERVPFIVTNGPPGMQLIRLIRHPHDVLANEGLKINAIYYITKAIIPPLNRCLLLLGADVNEWFTKLPRKILLTPALSIGGEVIASNPNAGGVAAGANKKSTISQYFSTTACIIECGRQTKAGICAECGRNAAKTFVTLQSKIAKIERGYQLTRQICQACTGRVGDLKCGSLDCPVLYVLEVKRRDLKQIAHFRNLLDERF